MSMITVEMTAKELGVWRAQQRLLEQLGKMDEGYTRLGQSSQRAAGQTKQGGDEAASSWKRGLASVQEYLIGLASIRMGVNAVKQAYSGWREVLQQLADESNTLTQTLIQNMTEAGDLVHGRKITRALEQFPGVTREEARQVYAGVRGGAPTEDIDRVLAVSEQAARVAPFKPENLEGFGRLAGELAALMPEKAPEDVADIALVLQQRAGDQIEKLGAQSFRHMAMVANQAGLSIEKTLAFASVATGPQGGMRATTFLSAFQKATASADELQAKAEAIREAARKETGPRVDALIDLSSKLEKFGQADLEQRLYMLQRDEALGREVIGEEAPRFRILTPERVEEAYQAIQSAYGRDLIAEHIQTMQQVPGGPEIMERRRLQVLDDIAKREDEIEGRKKDRMRERLEVELRGRGAISRWLAEKAFDVSEAIADIPGLRGKPGAQEKIMPWVWRTISPSLNILNEPVDVRVWREQAEREKTIREQEQRNRGLAGLEFRPQAAPPSGEDRWRAAAQAPVVQPAPFTPEVNPPPSLREPALVEAAGKPTQTPDLVSMIRPRPAGQAAPVPIDVTSREVPRPPAAAPPAELPRTPTPIADLGNFPRPVSREPVRLQAEVSLPDAREQREATRQLAEAASNLMQTAENLRRVEELRRESGPPSRLGAGPSRPTKR